MKRNLKIAVGVMVACAVLAGCASLTAVSSSDTSPASYADSQAALIAKQLQPRIAVAGEPEQLFDIHQRMQRYHVPSVSVAVMRNGVLDWSAVYRLPTAPPASVNTLYQAASISKSVTGALAQRLAGAGRIDLDAPVDACLKPLALPSGKQDAAHPVTLRGLLAHTAGATVSGFPGYMPGHPVPTDLQVIAGAAPSLTAAVAIQTVPGAAHAYSGGGYTIAQVALEQCLHTPFAELMRREVLAPLDLRRSTFQQPLPGTENDHARGHYFDGSEVEGGAYTYPELAAAGLWTTPGELAGFAIAVQQSWKNGTAFLSREQARDLLTPQLNNYAQGLFVVGEGEHKRFMHAGGNTGFKSTYAMYLESGNGVVVMTDGDNGSYLGGEIVKAVARSYGWPDFKPRMATPAAIDAVRAQRYAGLYRLDNFEGRYPNRYELKADGGGWLLVTPDLGPTRLLATGPASFVAPETGDTIELGLRDGQEMLLIGGRKTRRSNGGEIPAASMPLPKQ